MTTRSEQGLAEILGSLRMAGTVEWLWDKATGEELRVGRAPTLLSVLAISLQGKARGE